MGGVDLLAARDDLSFNPASLDVDDANVLEQLQPEVQAWWVEQFGEYVPENGGFFTPPQKEAIPLIREGTNSLVCAPTGSGKCVRPDTPLIISEDEDAKVVRAEELLDRRERKVADVEESGELYESSIEAFAFDDGEITQNESLVYSEPYEGALVEIQTTYGRKVEVTPEHPLLVETDDDREWRRAGEIEEGDHIGVPREIDLPEHRIELPVEEALEDLKEEFDLVLTADESDRLVPAVEDASDLHDLCEGELREAMALAGLSMGGVAERNSICIATVYNQVTHTSSHRAGETLDLLREELDPLDENEVVVKTNNGRLSRFTYPTEVDEELASLCAFVLAEGFIGQYDHHRTLSISQKWRTGLLDEALRTMREGFGVEFQKKDDIDYVISDTAFATFFSHLVDTEPGAGRGVRFPSWVMNAPRDVKRSFVSTFLSLEAEVREDEIRVSQANEVKLEQLTYLLLSFGIFPARGETEKYATNTDEQRKRVYHRLAVRGKEDLRTFLSEFDVRHPNFDKLARYAETTGHGGNHIDKHAFDFGDIRQLSRYYEDDEEFNDALGNVYEVVRRSGYITEQGLGKLRDVLDTLPDDEIVLTLSRRVERLLGRNLSWLEVTEKGVTQYEGEIIDLTVPGPHNFVGGRGGMYLHNTLASFTAIIDDLFGRARTAGLDNTVYCLYVSPLKSLANDIHRNLAVPLEGVTERVDEAVEVRHAIRHGDTSDYDRQRMLEETPHILNTTPETLAILLNSPKFREKLESVEYVVVDEIHSLAENKRGTHLAVSLERLEEMCETSPTRIGCSATVEPLSTVAEFLVGCEPGGPKPDADGHVDGPPEPRDYEIVDARFLREFDLELSCPTDDLINTHPSVVTDRFYDELASLVRSHENTLVFTNTRSGAERVLHNLREDHGFDESNSGCHHGSLSKDRRQGIEEQLKAGTLDVVTTSTSLELGIDMPHVDLVVQIGSPKSVAALLQRVGRAGHSPGETVKGRVVALDRDELVECAVMLKKAEEGFVDRVFVPENAYDVAVQHVYGMAINEVRPEAEVRRILRSAYPYRNFDDEAFERLFRYMTADYEGMEDRNAYAKVWRDANDPPAGEHHHEAYDVGEPLVGKRGRLARVIYMTNVGTIPDSFDVDVFVRDSDEWVGQLDEEYLDTLDPGDVFVLGGGRYEYSYRRGSKVYAEPTTATPTVPSWFSERLPLSYDLGREILAFQGDLLDRMADGGGPSVRSWLREFPLDENTVRAVARLFEEQVRYAGEASVSTPDRLAVEVTRDQDTYQRRYHVHSTYGRRFNDGLSRLLAYRCAQAANTNVTVAVADNGFTLSMPLNRKMDLAGILRDLDPAAVRSDLRASLDGTDLLKRYFRINATRSLLVLKRYKGYEKSAAQQQVSAEMLLSFARDLDGFAVTEETYREILEDKLNVGAIEDAARAIRSGDLTVESQQLGSPSPRAFGLATLMASDIVLAEDESGVLREFHRRVLKAIGEGEDAPAVVPTD